MVKNIVAERRNALQERKLRDLAEINDFNETAKWLADKLDNSGFVADYIKRRIEGSIERYREYASKLESKYK